MADDRFDREPTPEELREMRCGCALCGQRLTPSRGGPGIWVWYCRTPGCGSNIGLPFHASGENHA